MDDSGKTTDFRPVTIGVLAREGCLLWCYCLACGYEREVKPRSVGFGDELVPTAGYDGLARHPHSPWSERTRQSRGLRGPFLTSSASTTKCSKEQESAWEAGKLVSYPTNQLLQVVRMRSRN